MKCKISAVELCDNTFVYTVLKKGWFGFYSSVGSFPSWQKANDYIELQS